MILQQVDIWSLLGEEIPTDEFRESLKRGSGYENGKIRIFAAGREAADDGQLIRFIRDEYGVGGHSHTFPNGDRGFIDYDSKGYIMRRWNEYGGKSKRYSWKQVAEAIKELVVAGQYLTPREEQRYREIEREYAKADSRPPMPKPRIRYE